MAEECFHTAKSSSFLSSFGVCLCSCACGISNEGQSISTSFTAIPSLSRNVIDKPCILVISLFPCVLPPPLARLPTCWPLWVRCQRKPRWSCSAHSQSPAQAWLPPWPGSPPGRLQAWADPNTAGDASFTYFRFLRNRLYSDQLTQQLLNRWRKKP